MSFTSAKTSILMAPRLPLLMLCIKDVKGVVEKAFLTVVFLETTFFATWNQSLSACVQCMETEILCQILISCGNQINSIFVTSFIHEITIYKCGSSYEGPHL